MSECGVEPRYPARREGPRAPVPEPGQPALPSPSNDEPLHGPKLHMDLKLIRNLVRIMERGEVAELEIEDDKAGLRVHLRRGPSGGYAAPSVMMMQGGQAPAAPGGDAPLSGGEAGGPATEAPARAAGVEEITSPMIGTFYRKPSPDKDNFVDVGSAVKPGDTVCTIEAMKLFNEIESEVSGRIVKILVDDNSPVEYDQPLFLVEPA